MAMKHYLKHKVLFAFMNKKVLFAMLMSFNQMIKEPWLFAFFFSPKFNRHGIAGREFKTQEERPWRDKSAPSPSHLIYKCPSTPSSDLKGKDRLQVF